MSADAALPLVRHCGTIALAPGDVVFSLAFGKESPGGRRECLGAVRAIVTGIEEDGRFRITIERESTRGEVRAGDVWIAERAQLYAQKASEENTRFGELVLIIFAPGWRGERNPRGGA